MADKRILKFRHVTESQWLAIPAENRMMDTRYTIYSNDKSKILYEWMTVILPIGMTEEEIDEKLKNLKIDGGLLNE